MAKANISKEHIEFIRLVAEGVTFEKAFVTSCNKSVTPGYARSYGSRLAKKYAKEIQQAKKKAQSIVEHVKDKEVVKNALNKVLTQAEVDAKLCDIIKGEPIEVISLNAFGKPCKNKITATIPHILGAIETYNRRFGSNAPTKTDLTSNGESINAKPDLSKLTDGELRRLAELQSKLRTGKA